MKINYFVIVVVLLVLSFLNCVSNNVPNDYNGRYYNALNSNNYSSNNNIPNSNDSDGSLYYKYLSKKPNKNDKDFIDYCISLIGSEVPYGFTEQEPNLYSRIMINTIDERDATVVLGIDNNEIVIAGFGINTTDYNLAKSYSDFYRNYIIAKGFIYDNEYLTSTNDKVYYNDNYYITIITPNYRDSNTKIYTGLLFQKFTNNEQKQTEEKNLNKNESEFNIFTWIEIYSQYLGRRNNNPNGQMYPIEDSFLMKYNSKCSISAINENNVINSVGLIITNEWNYDDMKIFYKQLFDNIENGKFKIIGELKEEFIVEYRDLNFVITQPGKTIQKDKSFYLMFVIYKRKN